MNKEVKQESSVPVQSRVSIVTLAELEVYWSLDGYNIKTMSQLLSWSVNLLREILVANGKLPRQFETVTGADRHLREKGLYQASMSKRGFKKRATAISFENLRTEGVDPRHLVPGQYNMVHNKRSVEPFEGSVDTEKVAKLTEEALKIFNSLDNEDRLEIKRTENE